MSNSAAKNDNSQLRRFAWLSIGTAVVAISLKVVAYFLTNSVGLLSDALESVVNLVTGIITLVAITVASQPPDEDHSYGHSKAEYFSSGAEGTLILIAAIVILLTSIIRLFQPQPIQQIDVGIIVSIIAAILNFITARILLKAGQTFKSVALEANARHLITDVWTSASVVVGVTFAVLTNLQWLDPVIAILVALRIMEAGWRLVKDAILGLMDTALPEDELGQIAAILERYEEMGIMFHALRTRQSGRQRFLTVHIQVPGAWSVQRGHSLLERIEADIRAALTPISIVTHLEPMEDPVSWQDIALNRDDE